MFGFASRSNNSSPDKSPPSSGGHKSLAPSRSPKVMKNTRQKSQGSIDETLTIDWVSDKSTNSCVMCEKKFNTFKRRRHHCRQCGRVVCWQCSTHRLKLNGTHFENKPQRVCDGCFFTLTEKKQALQYAMSVREKEEQLLVSTSYISESLLRIFLLDGSSLTVSYDDCSTAAELTEHICFSIRCALFEVTQDIKDRDQYTLIQDSDTLVDIVARWNLTGTKTVKLVLPLYDLASARSNMSASSMAMRARKMNASLVIGTMPGPRGDAEAAASSSMNDWHDAWNDDESSQATSSYRTDVFTAAMEETGFASSLQSGQSVGSQIQQSNIRITGLPSPLRLNSGGSEANEVEDIKNLNSNEGMRPELMRARSELHSLQQKYDLLKNVHSRQTVSRSTLYSNNRAVSPMVVPNNKIHRENYDLFDEKVTTSRTSQSDTFDRDVYQNNNTFFDKDITDSGLGDEEYSEETVADDTPSPSRRSWRSIVSFKSRSASSDSPDKKKALMSPSKHHQHQHQHQQQQISSPISTQNRNRTDSNMSTTSLKPGPEMILLSPKDVHVLVKDISAGSADFHQLVRTFFHQTAAVENFLIKFHSAIRIMMTKEKTQTENLRKNMNGTEAKIPNFHSTFGDGVDLETETFLQVFEMTWALESLYAFVLGISEEWSTEVRNWILGMFTENLKLPLTSPARLKDLAFCLQRMELINSPAVTTCIQKCMQSLLDPSIPFKIDLGPELPIDAAGKDASALRTSGLSKSDQALSTIRRCSYALGVIVDELIPSFPQDVGILSIYLQSAERIIRSDVFDFFSNNKHVFSPLDLLTVLSFAERQRVILSGLNCDLPVLHELESEVLKVYLNTTDLVLRQAITRIHTSDERAVPHESFAGAEESEESGPGLSTNWPHELMQIHGDHMTLVSRHLQPNTREKVWSIILETLVDMVSRQKTWISKVFSSSTTKVSSSMVERLCAHINNHMCFADLLEAKLDALSGDLDDAAVVRITTQYNRITALFLAHADFSLHLLMQILVSEVKMTLKQGLFKNGWDNSVQVVHNTKRILQGYRGSLFIWLKDEHYASTAIGALAVSICNIHVEMILTAGLEITANTLERLDEDYQVWVDILADYSVYLTNSAQLLIAQLPWRHVITALSLDTRNMEDFVKSELYAAFGPATIKIWSSVMHIRGESKPVIDALFEVIMKGWEPNLKKSTPQCDVSTFVNMLVVPKFILPKGSMFK
jgi:hypothetical protein